MRKYIWFFYLAILVIITCSCNKDLDIRENFIKIDLRVTPTPDDYGMLVEATISGWQGLRIEEHGFVWTTESGELDILNNEDIEPLGSRLFNEGPEFQFIFDDLRPGLEYTFRAYVQVDDNTFYSEPLSASTIHAQLYTDSLQYNGGFQVQAFGHIECMKEELIAVQHGFLWSTVDSDPKLEDEATPNNQPGSSSFGSLGTRREDGAFSLNLTLEKGNDKKVHYIRSFVITSFNLNLDTLYGEVQTFDGDFNFWEEGPPFPGRSADGLFGRFVIGDKAYIIDLNSNLYSLTEGGQWTPLRKYPGTPGQIGITTSFKIEIKPGDWRGYVGPILNIAKRVNEFWEYNPQSDTWTEKAPLPNIEDLNNCGAGGCPREHAVGFGIGNKGYAGMGLKFINPGNRPLARDFYMYDPLDASNGLDKNGDPLGKWTKIKNFPGPLTGHYIFDATSEKGYVGTNMSSGLYEFDPTGGNVLRKNDGTEIKDALGNPVYEGKWDSKRPFPSGSVTQVGGFVLNEKFYVGLGRKGYLREQMWAFNPGNNKWNQVATYPGSVRLNATGFSLKNKGYLGFGNIGGRKLNDIYIFYP